MAENSKIEWCDHTFNPWIGCTKVSPGCQHCYAETLMDKRLGKVQWGGGNPRQRTSAANWKQVERWNRQAGLFVQCGNGCRVQLKSESDLNGFCPQCGHPEGYDTRPRVFVASLADWLDPEVPIEWLADLLDLIRRCPFLDFLMLTKRPGQWARLEAILGLWLRIDGGYSERWLWLNAWLQENPPANVWIGLSVEDQQRADERIPRLLNIPAKVRFLSCEPLLGAVDLSAFMGRCPNITGERIEVFNIGIHWVIVGGESGPKARPMNPDWARSLRDQCQAAGVPFFFKQWGEWGPNWYNDKDGNKIPGSEWIAKCGKKLAGRLLDGREWNEFPKGKDDNEH